ncbi:3D domain-containing protein [Dehalobacter sp.]|uniref:3D domain-containing protein n=1 Tax=Dehalobacter sp. TaxID=1962289 RepID=UPI0025908806|nr:3D domain-containing protein [Dehalobacter sp.]MDJ0305364.1 3D domain-containing protein [Dehalobacter sp.]
MRKRLYPSTIMLLIITGMLLGVCFQLNHKINNLNNQLSVVQSLMFSMAENQKNFSKDFYAFTDQWQTGTFKASAYSPLDDKNGLNSWRDGKVMNSGVITAQNINTAVSVDPDVIPLGSRVWIQGVGWRTAMDTGGVIKGNLLDIPMQTFDQAMEYGRQDVLVVWPRERR